MNVTSILVAPASAGSNKLATELLYSNRYYVSVRILR
jgi:hypothetical protein